MARCRPDEPLADALIPPPRRPHSRGQVACSPWWFASCLGGLCALCGENSPSRPAATSIHSAQGGAARVERRQEIRRQEPMPRFLFAPSRRGGSCPLSALRAHCVSRLRLDALMPRGEAPSERSSGELSRRAGAAWTDASIPGCLDVFPSAECQVPSAWLASLCASVVNALRPIPAHSASFRASSRPKPSSPRSARPLRQIESLRGPW